MISAAIRIPTPEEMKLLRARLQKDGPKVRPRPKIALVASPEPIAAPSNSNEPRALQQEDWHVRAWWAWKAWRGDDMPLMQFIRAACWLAGTTLEELRGSRSNRQTILKRHAVVKSVLFRHPELSLPKIGRAFNRDHTSILHIQEKNPKIKAMRARKPRGTLTEMQVREIRATVPKGGPYEPAAQKYGVTYSAIFYVVKGETWKHLL